MARLTCLGLSVAVAALLLGLSPASGQGTDAVITDEETGEVLSDVDGYGTDIGDSFDELRERRAAREGYDADYGRDGQEAQDPNILVKEGTVVICAFCSQLLHYNVEMKKIPASQVRNYYDDGTHGDEVAFDGLPSRINRVDDMFIGPHCWRNKLRLEAMADLMAFPETLEKYGQEDDKLKAGEVHPLSPHMFYSVSATAIDERSVVTWQTDELTRLEADISIINEAFLAPYEGYDWYPDYTIEEREELAGQGEGGQTQFRMSRDYQRSPYQTERQRRGDAATNRAAEYYRSRGM